jgi:molecular chaperone GrpE
MGKPAREAIKPGDAERMGRAQDGGETDSPAVDVPARGSSAPAVQGDDAAQERYLQLRTDFDSLRRRAAREREAGQLEGRRAALTPLLPVLDTLEHALQAGSTDPAFYEGVAATHRLFIRGLRDAGADPIESVGRPFDPNVHEAVAMIPANAGQPGTVAREIRGGWRLGDMLLRPAHVVVVAPPEAVDPWR